MGRDAMGSKRKRRRGSDSSYPSSSDGDSSYPSSSDGTSTDPTTPPRRSTAESLRSTRKKQDKLIKRMLEDLTRKQLKELTTETRKQLKEFTDETRKQLKELTDETRKQFKELTESQNKLCKQLELHINGLSGGDSTASRSESKQVRPPRYRLEFTCEVNDEIEKEKIIETKHHGKMISVALKDDQNQIVKTGPLASAKVMLVVINGEFNQQDNQCNWSRKEFEKAIRRPRNSAMGDVNESTESIVKNCFFNLIGGVKSHGDATILYNSSNKKVRLGVMMVSPTEERVLEGLSNPFFVRGHDRNRPKKQRQALVGFDCGEQNDPMQNPSWSHLTQPGEIIPRQLPGNTTVLSTEPSTSVEQRWIQQDQNSHPAKYRTSTAQVSHSLQAGGEHSAPLSDPMDTISATHNYSTAGGEHSVPKDLMDLNLALCNYSTGNDYIPTGSEQALAGFGSGERNALMLQPSHMTQPGEIITQQLPGNSIALPTTEPLLAAGNNTEPSTSAWIQQDQNSHPTMSETSMVQAAPHSLHGSNSSDALEALYEQDPEGVAEEGGVAVPEESVFEDPTNPSSYSFSEQDLALLPSRKRFRYYQQAHTDKAACT